MTAGCALFVPRQTVSPVLQTNQVTHLVTTNYVTNFLYAVNPAVTNLVGHGDAIARDLPAPWNWIGTIALGATTAILGAIARKKSQQAAVVPALIASVEAANNPSLKKDIKARAMDAGVQAE